MQDFSSPALLRVPLPPHRLRLQDFHPLRFRFPRILVLYLIHISSRYLTWTWKYVLVLCFSVSLFTTWVISLVFFSSEFLDVSVQRVCPPNNEYPVKL